MKRRRETNSALRECDDEREKGSEKQELQTGSKSGRTITLPRSSDSRKTAPCGWSRELQLATGRTTRSQDKKPQVEMESGARRVEARPVKGNLSQRPRPRPTVPAAKNKCKAKGGSTWQEEKKGSSSAMPNRAPQEDFQVNDGDEDDHEVVRGPERIIYLQTSSLRRPTQEELEEEKRTLERFKRDRAELLQAQSACNDGDKDSRREMDSHKANLSKSFPRRAKGLAECPFCQKALPRTPSKELLERLQYWIDRRHKAGRDLSTTDTIEDVCMRHLGESEILPEGRKRGWPRELDEVKLQRRLENHLSTMKRRIEEPESSRWFLRAREERNALGRAADDVGNQMRDLEDSQAGYYGEIGYEIMRGFLLKHFTTGTNDSPYWLGNTDVAARRRPIDSSSKFIDKVLLPELICLVIREDSKDDTMSLDQADQVRRESIRYGHHLFPSRPVQGRDIDFGSDDDHVDDDEIGMYTPPNSQRGRRIKPPRPDKVVSQRRMHNVRPTPLSQQKKKEGEDIGDHGRVPPSQPNPSASLPSPSPLSSSLSVIPLSSGDQNTLCSTQEPTSSLPDFVEFDASPRKRRKIEEITSSPESSLTLTALPARQNKSDVCKGREKPMTVNLLSDDGF